MKDSTKGVARKTGDAYNSIAPDPTPVFKRGRGVQALVLTVFVLCFSISQISVSLWNIHFLSVTLCILHWADRNEPNVSRKLLNHIE